MTDDGYLWGSCYHDEHEALETYLKSGCAVKWTGNKTALEMAANESSLRCGRVLLRHGYMPVESDWEFCVRLNRLDHFSMYLYFGFEPPAQLDLDLCGAPDIFKQYFRDEMQLARSKKVVRALLEVGKMHRQPWSHMFVLIAKDVWNRLPISNYLGELEDLHRIDEEEDEELNL